MKTKLVPLALLIPAVVLAQPASMPAPLAVTPPTSSMPAPAPPVNSAKAATALSTAKETSKQLNSKLSSNYGHGVCKSSGTLLYVSSLSYLCSEF